jgi:DNA/RNA-binding domain of Phe-tRNA-synthetase-like protein
MDVVAMSRAYRAAGDRTRLAASDDLPRLRSRQRSRGGGPTLADEEGAFGNPTSDSARTMITLQTTSTLVTCYAPAGYSVARLRQVLDGTQDTLRRACGGTVRELKILPEGG